LPIGKLIEKENADRLRNGTDAGQTLLTIDSELRGTLRRQGYRVQSVPEVGSIITVKSVVNDNRGDDNVAVDRLSTDIIDCGARAAEAVGQKLKSLSRGQQVLCVTHLPQIAAFADQHFLIDKREADGRTKMQIRLLDDRARMHEVARMVSGAKVTETSLQHAAQMIAGSR